jgi:DNA/RNA endonuclease G (NUC1)
VSRVAAVRLAAASVALFAACAPADRALAPAAAPRPAAGPNGQAIGVVISQVYGGGGNAGATYRNDFIELYNAGTEAVTLGGYSVQYASSTGTTWAVTPLAGTIAPGGYYLVQQAAGANTSAAPLPTPNATGTIAMSATNAKVALVSATAALAGACPTGAPVLDFVGYGSTNCAETSSAPTLSNTTAALRRDLNGGKQDTDNNSADFVAGPPTPRNGTGGGTGPAVSVVVGATPSTILVGGTTTLSATVTQNGAAVTPATVVWSVSPAGRVTFSNQSGSTVTATGVTTGAAAVTATVTVDGTEYAGTTTVTVNAAPTSLAVTDYSFRDGAPLPVGFSELFRAAPAGTTSYIRSGIQWSTSNGAVATVDALGNVTAVGNGTATITATETATGRTGAKSVDVTTFALSDQSVYADELQFGTPSDATPADEYLVDRPTFAASWNRDRGQPNWVAYNLEATHRLSGADRCDCFTPDPLLPADFPRVTTADYDGSGFSRGHMTMSADRTRGALDNAQTFYFTNIIPQDQGNNGGAWLALEQFLGNLAVGQDKEIFIVAGGAAYSGTLPNSGGRVAVPTRTWKVAVILDRNRGIADVRSASDVRVIAVDMPNSNAAAGSNWQQFQVSVDAIEALTGYDVLSALPDAIEAVIERDATSATRPVGMELAPERISLSTTSLVTAVLLSGTDFDATTFAAADLRLVTSTGGQVAPSSRGGVVSTSTRDVNGDGKLDRVVSFSTAALQAAGLSADAPALTMRLAGTSAPAWLASDPTPPVVAP